MNYIISVKVIIYNFCIIVTNNHLNQLGHRNDLLHGHLLVEETRGKTGGKTGGNWRKNWRKLEGKVSQCNKCKYTEGALDVIITVCSVISLEMLMHQ